MVVHEDSVTPIEVAIVRKPHMEQKSYVIVKNHVRELINTTSIVTNEEELPENQENIKIKRRKSDKNHKKNVQLPTTLAECENKTKSEINIDENDLKELRTVYTKCKEVIRKIESKYGHLLDLESEAGPSTQKKQKSNTEESSNDECDCIINKKIVFDDEGKQSTVEVVSEKHICSKKVKKPHGVIQTRSKTIAIEYTDNEINLPDDLRELYNLLQDVDIGKPLRNKIINKIKLIKQEYVNEIKFNKHAIIEKLKVNPDEALAFKGTNLSTIPGYL